MLIRNTLTALLVPLLAGCYAPPPVYVLQAPPEPVATEAPPPPRLEIPPVSPDESYLWQPGYWNWENSEYRWQEGMWMPPRDGYALIGASYNFFGGCWHFRAPYWCPLRICGHGRPGPTYARAPEPRYAPAPAPRRDTAAAPPVVLPPIRVTAEPSPNPEPVRAPAPATPAVSRPVSPRRVVVIRDDSEPAVLEGPRRGATAPQAEPTFRGHRSGRPVFSDDPDAVRAPEGFHIDSTGAVTPDPPVQGSNSGDRVFVRPRSAAPIESAGTVSTLRPGGPIAPPEPRVWEEHRRFAAPPADPPVARPVERPQTWAPPAPVYQAAPSAPVFHSPPPAPSYRSAPSAPVFHAPPPAPSYHAAPSAPVFHSPPPAPSYRSAPSAPVFHSPPPAPAAPARAMPMASAPAGHPAGRASRRH